MGADIHGVFQTRWSNESEWWDEGEVEDGRNYLVFAALAGVRNYYNIKPFDEPRGFPEDFTLNEYGDSHPHRWREKELTWMGDHSYTWFTTDELLAWDGWDQEVNFNGLVSREAYEKGTPYDYYSMSVGGGMVINADERGEMPEGWTHIRTYWTETLRENCKTFIAWLNSAHLKGEQVRVVIGFDS